MKLPWPELVYLWMQVGSGKQAWGSAATFTTCRWLLCDEDAGDPSSGGPLPFPAEELLLFQINRASHWFPKG